MGAGVVPADVLLLTKKGTFFHKKPNNKQLLSLLSSEKTKTTTKKIPKKFPLPQYFKMMVLLLYIQNQDKKNDQNRIKFPEKKIPNPATTTQNKPQKIPQQQKFATHHNFFLQVMNKILERKKNNQKTKQAREKEIMFLFLTPRFRKKDYN